MHRYRSEILVSLALMVLSLAVFGPSCGNGFVNFDDNVYVIDNPQVRSGLTWPSIRWAFASNRSSHWHPLTWLSLQLDYSLYGLKPWGFHLTNVLLHTASTVLLFQVLRRMTASVGRSAFVAALFAVHPLHVESVAWVSERKDVLSALFWMLTLWAYAGYAGHPGWQRYLLVLAAFALGLMAKPMLVTLPCVLLLLDYWPLRRLGNVPSAPVAFAEGKEEKNVPSSALRVGLRLVLEKLPLFAVAITSGVITWYVQRRNGAVNSLELMPFRLANAAVSYVSYMGKMIWPFELAPFYPYPRQWFPTWQIVAAGLVLLGISGLALRLVRRCPYVIVGWFWYLGTLAPVIGVMKVLGEHLMADRYTYIPLIGLFILLTWGVADWAAARKLERMAAATGGLVLAVLIGCSWIQASYWHDSITLWEHSLLVTEDNATVQNNLGVALERQGEYEKAKNHYAMAVRCDPNDFFAQKNLGAALMREGRLDEALGHYEVASKGEPNDPQIHNNMGFILEQEGKLDEAIAHYRTALLLDPDLAKAHFNLGGALGKQGKLEEAIDQLRTTLRLDPDHAEPHNSLGAMLARQGKLDEAIDQFAAVLHIEPENPTAQLNLAGLYTVQGKLHEAVEQYQTLLRIQPTNALAYDRLGQVFVQQNELSKAADCYRQAIRLEPANPRYHCDLAHALRKQDQGKTAEEEYQEAFRLDPAWPEKANEEAWTLATDPGFRNGPLALSLAQQACEATNNHEAKFLDTLAAAYAEVGDFDQAVETAHRALQAVSSLQEKKMAREIADRLQLYEKHRPYHAEG